MKFYGRKEELKRLTEISGYASSAGYLTMMGSSDFYFKNFVKAVFVGDNIPSKLKANLSSQDIQVLDISDY